MIWRIGEGEDCPARPPTKRGSLARGRCGGHGAGDLLKIVLMLVATPGMIAPAATATKPAIKAYSMRSWPRVSFQILSFQTRLVIRVIFYVSFIPATNFLRHYE
jgi:hypothetical protein